MVRINYNCYILRKITKTSSESVMIEDNLTLSELIDILTEKYGEKFKKNLIDSESGRLKLLILINGISVDDLEHEINNTDKLNIISLTTGG